jgi:hypothetical protein
MLKEQPSIELYQPAVLDATLEALGDSLQLPRPQVLALVKQQPLYLVQPHLARENLAALPQLLGAPLEAVVRALRSCPAALAMEPAALRQRMAGLARALGLEEGEAAAAVLQAPLLLQHEPRQLELRLGELQEALCHLPLAARRVALALPEVLDARPAALAAALAAVAESLAATPAEAAAVAVACPRLLLLGPRQVQQLVEQAAGVFAAAVGRPAALRMLLVRGELLAAPPSVLHSKWGALVALGGTCSAWREELGLLAPEAAAELAAQDFRRLARLRCAAPPAAHSGRRVPSAECVCAGATQPCMSVCSLTAGPPAASTCNPRGRFLVDMGRQRQCSLASALTVAEGVFAAQYPDYQGWLAS